MGPARRRGQGRSRARGESGDALVEAVIATPLLIAFVLVVLQLVLWAHGDHVAQAAAVEGARAARVLGGTAALGEAKARSFLRQTGATIVLAPSVEVRRDGGTTRAEVRGRAPRLVPFLTLTVAGVSEGPSEAFRPPAEALESG